MIYFQFHYSILIILGLVFTLFFSFFLCGFISILKS
jgi:hypothetical protein